MKESQFEEITAALSLIVCLIAYGQGLNWIAGLFFVKCLWDYYCALKISHKEAKEEIAKEVEQQIKNKIENNYEKQNQ